MWLCCYRLQVDPCKNILKMTKWSSQWTQFMQLRKEAWKKKNSGLQRGMNPWPRDTGAMLYQLSYEATDVGSRSIVGSYVPVKEFFFQASLRNCINCVHCDDHFFIFISFLQFIIDLFHISETKIILLSLLYVKGLNGGYWLKRNILWSVTVYTISNNNSIIFGKKKVFQKDQIGNIVTSYRKHLPWYKTY